MPTLKILDVYPKQVRNVSRQNAERRRRVLVKTVWFVVLQVGTQESRLSIPEEVALRIREEMQGPPASRRKRS